MTWFYCSEAPELRLGPDITRVIRFRGGFAEVARDDPDYDEKLAWVAGSAIPIETLGDDLAGQVAGDAPGAVTCPECGKTFSEQRRLNAHLLSHRPKS